MRLVAVDRELGAARKPTAGSRAHDGQSISRRTGYGAAPDRVRPDQAVVDVSHSGELLRGERVRCAAAAFPGACARLRAPGMTTVTPGWSRIQRSANRAVVASAGTSGTSSRTAAGPTYARRRLSAPSRSYGVPAAARHRPRRTVRGGAGPAS